MGKISTKMWIGIAVVFVILIALYIKSKNDAAKAAAIAAAAAANNTNNFTSGPAWLQALNSPALVSLLGGFGAGVGSNVSGGGK